MQITHIVRLWQPCHCLRQLRGWAVILSLYGRRHDTRDCVVPLCGRVRACVRVRVLGRVRVRARGRVFAPIRDCGDVRACELRPGASWYKALRRLSAWYPAWIQKCTCSSRRLSVRKVSVHNSMLPVQRNACRRRMKFIHACRLCLRPIFAAAVPLF